MNPVQGRQRWNAGRIGLHAFVAVSALFFLLPLYIMVATSLKTMPEIRAGNLLAWPERPHLDAWRIAWSSACSGLACGGVSRGFASSWIIAVPSVVASVGLGVINGYALALWRPRGANTLLLLLLVAGFIPYQVMLFPLVKMMSVVGLYSSLPGIVLMHVLFSLPIMTLIFRNHYAGLPAEIFKAARVDGAGFWQILRFVILPLSPGILIVAIIIQFTGIWNDYLLGLVFAGRELQPMTVQLANLVGSARGERHYDVEMAATLLTALPPLLVYLASGRFFVRGITAGAMKG